MTRKTVFLVFGAVPTLLVVAGQAVAQTASFISSAEPMTIAKRPSKRLPTWGGNAVVLPEGPVGEPNFFLALDRSGRAVMNASFNIQGSAHTYVRSYSRAANGTLALCGSSYSSDGSGAPFLAWVSPDGIDVHILRTEPFYPELAAIAADGTLWATGRELDTNLKSIMRPEAGVLRQFDSSGKQLRSFIPRSTIPDGTDLSSNFGYLVPAGAGVGWLRYANGGARGAYVEVSPDGVTATYGIPRLPTMTGYMVSGLGVTSAGDVFASAIDAAKDTKGWSILKLNRKTGAWSPIDLTGTGVSTRWIQILGTEGPDLVVRSTDVIHFLRVKEIVP